MAKPTTQLPDVEPLEKQDSYFDRTEERGQGEIGTPRGNLRWFFRETGHSFKHDLLSAIFPCRCAICQQRTDWADERFALCQDCLDSMIHRGNRCQKCSAPLPESLPECQDCIHCRDEKWTLRRAYSLGKYHGKLRTAVILMKRPYFEALSLGLGRALAEHLKAESADLYDAIIPTPQHWLKRIWHRSNSAELIAESISNTLSIPMHRLWLRRSRITKKQGLLGVEQRRKNVRNAFALNPWHRVRGANVLLVDDILTSGSTANEMARVLNRAGANRIDLAAIARTIS